MSDIKFAHGTKANAEAAVIDGRLDSDDIVIFSETDDEIGIVNHSNELKRIKSRTNEDIVLTDEAIDLIPAGYTIPAGTSIDDAINQFKTWLIDNKENVSFSKKNDYFITDTIDDTYILKTKDAILPVEWGASPFSTATHNCVAQSYYSHAEGYDTQTSGVYSHAEGYDTQASGDSSHAEGNRTKAYGSYSHAEGYYTKASKISSHAEGYETSAIETASHAEGRNTTASGHASHAEGYYTSAAGKNQHAQGVFNIEDTENKYAHIVGNGTSATQRSNAHTLDWDGNSWYAGEVTATDNTGISHNLTEKVNKADILQLPIYTTEDEGKVLQIVNGVPQWIVLSTN